MKKRILSLILVLIIALGLAPVLSVSASDTEKYDWYNFRNSETNMAITDAKTPVDFDTTALKWRIYFGEANYVSPPLIVNGNIVVMAGNTLYKFDANTGEKIAHATMEAASSQMAYTPPVYADGMIICALDGGIVKAFNSETLELKWVYTDELGGQDQVPVMYSDGYVYTGFYSGNETGTSASFVCLNAKTGKKVWSKSAVGGFYWSGPVIVGDYVIFGSDNGAGTGSSGASTEAYVYSCEKTTGDVISSIPVIGDQRSSIAYNQANGRVYFTTKQGYLCSAAFDSTTGLLSDLKQIDLGLSSTNTPVVYGDKIYVCATVKFKDYIFAVVKENNTNNEYSMELLYTVAMKGEDKSSLLLSTSYYETEGKLYFYSSYNNIPQNNATVSPGGLTLVKIDPTKNTAEDAEVIEIYDALEYNQACITSPICGEDGTIYYKNDSCTLFAVETNNAYLSALTANTGKFDSEFSSQDTHYELVVPIGTQNVTFTPTGCEGSTVTVNGVSASTPVALSNGAATANIVVTKGSESRTYTVNIHEAEDVATLSELMISENSTYNKDIQTISPEFSATTYVYKIDTATGTTSKFSRIWTTATDENATVKAYAVSNVKESKYDAETFELPSGTSSGHTRYSVYFADSTKPAVVKIKVTSENGTTENEYYVVLSTANAATEADALYKDIKTAKDAQALIDGIGEVTLASANAIKSARTAYDALTENQKAYVANYAKLTAAEEKLELLKDENTANPIDVEITLINAGNVVIAQQSVTVEDQNNNGIFDVDDTLFAAHEKYYEGGAEAGYASSYGTYGLSIDKLWGDTSYSYGYWLNNASCWSLADEVKDGDNVVAFVYTDKTGWSDTYSRLDKFEYSSDSGKELTVKYELAGYDANWNTVFTAQEGAIITAYDADGKAVAAEEYKVTDNGDGTYTVIFTKAGNYTLTATYEDIITVPAIAKVEVKAVVIENNDDNKDDKTENTKNEEKKDNEVPDTSDKFSPELFAVAVIISLLGTSVMLKNRKKYFN